MKSKTLSKKLLIKSIFSLVHDNKCTVANLREYVAAGYDIHYQEPKTNHNILIKATSHANEDVVLELIELGSCVDFTFANGQSYLSFVANYGLLKVVKKLIEIGISPVDEKFITTIDYNILRWMKKYDTQKELITKYPQLYPLLKKKVQQYEKETIDIVHPKIKKEFAYLEQSIELNLF